MIEKPHHIRLLAGFELEPRPGIGRLLDRELSQEIAQALARDLSRVCPAAEHGMLVLAGSLLEPAELLRPGDPAWTALADLSRPVIRERGFNGQILAIGSHQGRAPDSRLSGDQAEAQGAFLALPLLLIVDPSEAASINRSLESTLFEKGSIDPPARALLDLRAGVKTVHGQLLTRNDLLAIQHVQMDTAGMGAFWPLVEQILVDPTHDHEVSLPGDLNARWEAARQGVVLPFSTFDNSPQALDDYAQQLAAFRAIQSLLALHGINWACEDAQAGTGLSGDLLREPAGHSDENDGVTVQLHPACGLIAWSVCRGGQLEHWYPLNSTGFDRLQREIRELGLPSHRSEPAAVSDGRLTTRTGEPA
ncbi:MAG: hypothetical protein ACXIUL_13245 [Wenzhouxiangella sp.]